MLTANRYKYVSKQFQHSKTTLVIYAFTFSIEYHFCFDYWKFRQANLDFRFIFFLSWKAAVAAEIRQLTPTPFYELDYLVSVVKITPTSFFQQ